jgi:hypothetical protein
MSVSTDDRAGVGQIVSVRFKSSRDGSGSAYYDYEVPRWFTPDFYPEGIKVGDHVVVDSPTSGYVVVEVIEIKDRLTSEFEGRFKPIVDVVDDSRYIMHLEREERAEQIKRELRRLASERDEIEAFRTLAGDDKTMNDLLEELLGLRG